MFLRFFFTIVFLIIFATLTGTFTLKSAVTKNTHKINLTTFRPSLNLAPLSLGNPEAAKSPLITIAPTPPIQKSNKHISQIIQQVYTAKKGDTVEKVLTQAGVNSIDTQRAILALKQHYNPKKFRLGQKITIYLRLENLNAENKKSTLGTLLGLRLYSSLNHSIKIERNKKGQFSSYKEARNLKTVLNRTEGLILSNLYLAGLKAGLSDSGIAELIRIYSWDVDFQRDIRRGDFFEILYEKTYSEDGTLIKSNKIIYANLNLSGKSYLVYRFRKKNRKIDYYNEKGMSTRKALMRTPIDGARLSSRFGKRKHPILGFTRMHKGIDFAAPIGTPIYAAGNGKIKYAGWKGAYGRFVVIHHNKIYSSAYAHMKRIAPRIKRGIRVKQGQVIGYVGTSGRSTGPHLHYEIRRHNRQTNPLTIRMPSGEKLSGDELKRFTHVAEQTNQKFLSLSTENIFKIN